MIFFTADLHLGHKNIIKYCNRPWSSIEEHDNALLENWHNTVSPNDVVYVLGDVTMGSIRRYADRLRELPGEKHLIAGNHDAVWDDTSPRALEDAYNAGFASVSSVHRLASARDIEWPSSLPVVLSHLPAEGESFAERPDRFLDRRPAAGDIVLCGHVHDLWVHKGLNINVGVDVRDYRPVPAVDLWYDVLYVRSGDAVH